MIIETCVIGYFVFRWIRRGIEQELLGNVTADRPSAVVTVIGRPSVGKSSVGNALAGYDAFKVDVAHDTTIQVQAVNTGGYRIQDCPGVFPTDDQKREALFKIIQDSKIVLYVTTGQLFQFELLLLQEICAKQRSWDQAAGSGSRVLGVFINKNDVRLQTMTEVNRHIELEAVRLQCKQAVSASDILIGSASPYVQDVRQPPNIDDLKNWITSRLGIV